MINAVKETVGINHPSLDESVSSRRTAATIQAVPPDTPPPPSSTNVADSEPGQEDFDRILRANITRVFGERVREQRQKAIAELYDPDAVVYEPHGAARGHDAIDQTVQTLLDSLPPDFVFTPQGVALGHHGLGRLRWSSGPAGGAVAVTGTDIAQIAQGRIHTLHVLLDPPNLH